MSNNHDLKESQIIEQYKNALSHYSLNHDQIVEIRQAIVRVADQILDHYFDSLGDL